MTGKKDAAVGCFALLLFMAAALGLIAACAVFVRVIVWAVCG